MQAKLAFEWVGGEACLDFNNTVSWNRDGHREERLLSYPDLIGWAVESGTLSGPGPLLDAARRRPRAAAAALAKAHEVRSVLRDVFFRLAQGGRPTPKRLLDLERFLSEGFRHLGVTAQGRGYAWSWLAPAGDLVRPLWPVAWSAARLLTSAEVKKEHQQMLAEPFTPFTFSPSGAAVYQLGQFGTAVKLKEWDSKP